MFVWWGPQLVNIYNDAYAVILGPRHPRAFGRPARETRQEIWPIVGAQADVVMTRGEATWNERVRLVLERHGYPEETWFTWSYSPIPDEAGGVGGLFCACTEDTATVRAEGQAAEVRRTLAASEARFRQLADAMPQIVFAAQPDGTVDYLNRRWYEYTGLPEGEVAVEGARQVHTEEGLKRVLEAWPEALRTGRPYEIEYLLRRRDGAYRWHLGRALPIKDAEGRVVRWYGTNTDIHALKTLEDAQAAEKRVLEMITTGTPVPDVLCAIARAVEGQSSDGMICSILMLDETGHRLQHGAAPSLPDAYNQAIAGQLIGPGVGSCGTSVYEGRPVFVTDIPRDPLWAAYRELAAAHGLAACCSTPVIAADGVVLGTVAMYYREPHDPSPRDRELIVSATRLVGIVLEKDLVDRRLRQSLEAEQFARTEAERASRMKDEFLATLSHELRTPLNAILGWTQILRLTPDVPPTVAQGVDVIERNTRAQATIIQDLLDMSAILSGKVRLDVRPTDVVGLLESAVAAATPAAQAKAIRIDAVFGPGTGIAIRGDESRLQQVVWNLLSNAVKFTPREGRILLVADRTGDQVEIRVTDSGMGIPADFLPHVFDRFRQADASTTRQHRGMGLGLSIVKQIVELHGGTVRVSSDGAGRGATFVVGLPIAMAPPAEPVAPAPGDGEPAATGTGEPVDVRGLRVLVVDDDADAREMVQRLLAERGAVVTGASSSAEAMRLVLEQRFDVLVSDIGMPGEDGHALIRRVRALGAESGGDLPAVALTAYARPEDREKAMRSGFQEHATKPVEPGALFALVAAVGRKG
jgi:PAS domain S-box-containing protein